MNNTFSNNNNRPQGNIFGGGNTNQGGNNIFGNTNQNQNQNQGGNIFGNNQNQNQSQNQGNTMFNNQNQNQGQGTNIFGNNPQQQNQQQQSTNIFGNQNQNQNTGNSMYNTNNQQQRPNIFGGNQQQQTTGNIFGGNQQQQTGNIFGGNQQQQTGNIFGGNQQQQQPTSNIFGNQQQQTGNIFGGNPQQQQQGQYGVGVQQQNMNMNIPQNFVPGLSQYDRVKYQIQQFNRKLDHKNLEHIRLDQLNIYRDQRVGSIGNAYPQIKNAIIVIVNNMKQIRETLDKIKKQNEELDKKASQYIKNVQDKLVKYKECLIQNVSQTNMLEQVKEEIELVQSQVNGHLIPLFNAYKLGKHHSFESPDDFTGTIAKKILQKMMQLNSKLDEIISCQQAKDNEDMSQQDSTTINVLQQLLAYYQNVSAKVLQFNQHFKQIKRSAIQNNRRSSSYQQIYKRIQQKVDTKMKKDFKCYDMIKQIEGILEKREKREKEIADSYDRDVERKTSERLMNGGWGSGRGW